MADDKPVGCCPHPLTPKITITISQLCRETILGEGGNMLDVSDCPGDILQARFVVFVSTSMWAILKQNVSRRHPNSVRIEPCLLTCICLCVISRTSYGVYVLMGGACGGLQVFSEGIRGGGDHKQWLVRRLAGWGRSHIFRTCPGEPVVWFFREQSNFFWTSIVECLVVILKTTLETTSWSSGRLFQSVTTWLLKYWFLAYSNAARLLFQLQSSCQLTLGRSMVTWATNFWLRLRNVINA